MHMLFTVQIILVRFFFFTESTSMVHFCGVFLVPLLWGHLVLKFQVFDNRRQKIICLFFFVSDDSYFYTAIHY